MANEILLRDTVQRIVDDPKSWDQHSWVRTRECGTTFCLAGHAAVESGVTLMSLPKGEFSGLVWRPDGRYDHVSEVARRELALTEQEAHRLFFWVPETESGVPALEQLGKRIEDVTGVHVLDIVYAAQREQGRG